jgi:antitoxin CcdA
MKHEPIGRKRATNVSLPENLVVEARTLGVNVSTACTKGLAADVKQARLEKWKSDNAEAIDYWRRWSEENELPLAKYRAF